MVDGCAMLHCGAAVGDGGVKSVLAGYRSVFTKCADHVSSLSQAVSDAQTLFVETETRLTRAFSAMQPADVLNLTGAAAQATADKVKNAFMDMLDNLKTGAVKMWGSLKDCIAAFQADWEAKGLSYRIIKGAGAVVDIIVGTAAVVAAATGTGITAGVAAPVAVLIGTYGANQAISGIADLYNCITGNVDDVGNVNLLKSLFSWTGGAIGSLVGGQEMGERVGEVIYTAGELTTTVVSLKNLAGKIAQSKTAASTLKQSASAAGDMLSKASGEVRQGMDGLGYILTKVNLRDVPYQFAQFTKTIPNIMDVVSEVSLIEKGVSGASKIINAGVDCINTLAGWEMIQQPSFFETISQVKDTISAPSDTVSDIRDSIESIGNAFAVAFM